MQRRYRSLLQHQAVQFCAAWLLCFALPLYAFAGDVREAERIARNMATARAELEAAESAMRGHLQLDWPLRMRHIASEIALREAEVASFQRRIAEYESYPRWRYSSPFIITLENARLGLLGAQLRLADLREERWRLQRAAPDERRHLELAVETAAQKLRDAAAGK